MGKEIENTIQKILKERERDANKAVLNDKEMQELKESANYIFSLPQGKIVARAMMKISGIYRVPKNASNPIEMGAERGKEAMYLFMIKGLLDHDLVCDIERRIEKKEK